MTAIDEEHIFDVVVVGGGPSAIGLLRGILEHISSSISREESIETETPPFTICLIERGGSHGSDSIPGSISSSIVVRDPSRWLNASLSGIHAREGVTSNDTFSSVHKCEPQESLGNRILRVPVGKSLGGGTNINACLVQQPVPTEPWPGIWNDGSKLKDASTAILNRMIEDGGVQSVNMSEQYKRTVFGEISRSNNENSGVQNHRIDKDNYKDEEEDEDKCKKAVRTTGRFPSLVLSVPTASTTTEGARHRNYHRVSYHESLLEPFLRKNNHLIRRNFFKIYEGVQVERLILQQDQAEGEEENKIGRAKGVVCLRQSTKEQFVIRARNQVVLACGAFFSPALLLVSGIGNSEDLKQAGIHPVFAPPFSKNETNNHGYGENNDIPVGYNLKDHVILPRQFLSLQPLWKSQRSVSTVQGFSNLDIISKITRGNVDKGEEKDVLRFQMMLCDGSVAPQIVPLVVFTLLEKLIITDYLATKKKNFLTQWCSFWLEYVWLLLRFLFEYTPLGILIANHIMGVNICLLNPKSKGRVSLKAKIKQLSSSQQKRTDVFERNNTNQEQRGLSNFDLVINAGYLTDERDFEALAVGFDATNNLFPSLTEACPGSLYRNLLPRFSGDYFDSKEATAHSNNKDRQEENKEKWRSKNKKNQLKHPQQKWIRRYISDYASPYYHWCGTCKMGVEDNNISLQLPVASLKSTKLSSKEGYSSSFVVNDRLMVQGFENLRVCDASVFPSCISGPISLACASLGYATAQMVIKDCTGKSQ